MEQELSILILEDDPQDAELILCELRKGGVPCVPKCVAEEDEFVAALGESRPDLILSDYKLPGITGVDAMALARQQHPDVPFILVTGVLGEEMAVGLIKGGATDFVLKHRLFQLVPAILRSLREAEQLTQLRESEARFRQLAESFNERKVAKQRLAAEHAVLHALAESASLGEAAAKILRSVCKCLGWEVGALWELDHQAKVLRCLDVWSSGAQWQPLVGACRAMTFSHGEGLPGRVWKAGKGIWIPDSMADPLYTRGPLAAQCGLHGAFGFPLLLKREVVGVIEFFSGQIREPDGPLLEMMSALGWQIGQFVAQKRSEEALRNAEAKYRSIFENASEGIFQTTPEGHFLSANPALARMSGYDAPEELMAHCPDIGQQLCVDPESRLVLKRRLETEGYVQGFENRIYCKDGSIKWVRINAHVVRDAAGRVLYYEGTSQDITEQKRAAVQLATLAHAVETTSEAMCITDLQDRFTFVNRVFLKLYGYTEEEILGKTPAILVSPSNPPSLLAEILEQTRLGGWRGEVLDLRKDGSEVPIALSTSQIKDHSGQVIGLMGVAQDIAERKKAESILRESEEKFRTLFESAPIGIALHDSAGHYVHTNQAYDLMVGYSGVELRRLGVKIITHPDDIEEGRQLFRELREGKLERYQREKRYLRKDGQVVWAQSSASAVRGAGGQLSYIISMVEDITERKQLEKELLEISASERRHIGHELHDGLGQYLAGIAFRAKALQQALAAEGLRHAEDAQELATLVSNAISQTRNLARGLDPIEIETIGLLAALQNLVAEVEKFFDVACSFHCGEAALPLDARSALVLYRIAQEAVHNALTHGEAGQIFIELAMRADRICLSVQDNGIGFEVESKKQAGMGLRVMEYRARSIGAKLEVMSRPDQGTEVCCLVPCKAPNGS